MNFKLRPVRPDDRPFEIELMRQTRSDIFDHLPLPDSQKAALIKNQVELQRGSYAAQYPNARIEIIEVDGEAVGRYIESSTPTEIFIVDIAILPSHQAQGIGKEILSPALREVKNGKTAYLHVPKENHRAQQFYERLGFELCGEIPTHFRMKATPESVASITAT